MKVIIGLGNIGEKYQNTRHNCGFIFIDQFFEKLKKEMPEIKFHEDKKLLSAIVKTNYKNQQILLVKPTTYMNLSGEALANILSFYKATTDDVIIIYDDIDLPLGTTRFREKGSAGTHNGMRNIIEKLGTENFKRIRIGIESRGELNPKEQDLHSFVLNKFKKEELPLLEKSLDEAIIKVEQLISE